MAKLFTGALEGYTAHMAIECAYGKVNEYLFEDMEARIKNKHKEQSVLALMNVLKLLYLEYREETSVVLQLQRSDFKKMKDLFYRWHEAVDGTVPKKYHAGILKTAEEEFASFAKMRWPDGSMDETALSEE